MSVCAALKVVLETRENRKPKGPMVGASMTPPASLKTHSNDSAELWQNHRIFMRDFLRQPIALTDQLDGNRDPTDHSDRLRDPIDK